MSYSRPVRRFALMVAGGVLLAGLASCKPTPNQFRVVPLEEAQQRLRNGGYTVVEAVEGSAAGSEDARPGDPTLDPGADIRWELPLGQATQLASLPPGPLLIVAPSEAFGYRCAAAAARIRHGDVVLVISESAEQRRTLYAPAAAKGAAS